MYLLSMIAPATLRFGLAVYFRFIDRRRGWSNSFGMLTLGSRSIL